MNYVNVGDLALRFSSFTTSEVAPQRKNSWLSGFIWQVSVHYLMQRLFWGSHFFAQWLLWNYFLTSMLRFFWCFRDWRTFLLPEIGWLMIGIPWNSFTSLMILAKCSWGNSRGLRTRFASTLAARACKIWSFFSWTGTGGGGILISDYFNFR